jgi:hypothetical protein
MAQNTNDRLPNRHFAILLQTSYSMMPLKINKLLPQKTLNPFKTKRFSSSAR